MYNDLQLSLCEDLCAALMFSQAPVGLQNIKVWKKPTGTERKKEVKEMYVNTDVHESMEQNKMGFYDIAYD